MERMTIKPSRTYHYYLHYYWCEMPVVLAPINDVGIYIHMQHGSLVAYCMAGADFFFIY
jgi:hypothetical protein